MMEHFMQGNDFYIGANYWDSRSSIHMWSDFSPETIDSDFEKLASCGIRTLRMFLLWPDFQPLKAYWANPYLYELRVADGSPLPDTEAGRAGVSEEACKKFEILCKLAEKHGIKLIVGLLTGHMSFRFFAPPAFEGKNFLSDPLLIKWETRFVRYFVKRFREEPSIIAWDLGNECSGYGVENADQGYVGMTCIAAAIRESDPTRPIVSGFDGMALEWNEPFSVRDTAELTDITTTHPYQIFSSTSIDAVNSIRPEIDPAMRSTLYETLGRKPCFVEEVGSIGYTNCSEKTEAAFLRTMLWSTYAQGCHGCFWWCAFDQGQFDYAPYDWNNYGSNYGLFRADGSEKPVAGVTRGFDAFLRNFPYAKLPHHSRQAVVIVPRETREPLPLMNTVFILAKQANLDVSFVHAEEKLPESGLYILPGVRSSKPMFYHRLKELLEKVKNGAVLYLSLGDTLFRDLPELTGLTIASRVKGGSETVTLGDANFDFAPGYKLNVESVADTCEVLATGGDDRPVFVRNAYGKGAIYFSAIAIEDQITERPGAFEEDAAPYRRFYEAFAAEATAGRAAVSASPSVLLTEHDIGEGRRIVIAVNYADHDIAPEITLRPGWKLVTYHHGGKIVRANDAAVLEVAR